MQSYLSPLSIQPLPGPWDGRIPSLDKDVALLWFGLGLAGGVGGVMTIATLAIVEPFSIERSKDVALLWWAVASGTALLLTTWFGIKQWRFYYSDSGVGKEGIFLRTLGHVNLLEQTLDVTLSLVAGLLVAVSALPTVWFSIVGLYSLCVAVRAAATLARPRFAEQLRRRHIAVPEAFDRLEVRHNDRWVPAVLCGWIATHIAVVVLAASTLVALHRCEVWPTTLTPSDLMWAALRRVGACGLLSGVLVLASDLSYKLGRKLWPVKSEAVPRVGS